MTQKDLVHYGSDVSAGTYECADCGRQYSNQSKTSLPPCKRETGHEPQWKDEILSGTDK